jgi:hypothetical protein
VQKCGNCSLHSPCDEGGTNLTAAVKDLRAVEEGLLTVQSALERHPARMVVDHDNAVLVVRGCDGFVHASIDLAGSVDAPYMKQ